MARSGEQILTEIDTFKPVECNWLPLDDLLAELWSVGVSSTAIPTLLRVFERFPDEDGAGVFWSIVHGLESLPGYEPILLASASEHPTEFKRIMVDRLLRTQRD